MLFVDFDIKNIEHFQRLALQDAFHAILLSGSAEKESFQDLKVLQIAKILDENFNVKYTMYITFI